MPLIAGILRADRDSSLSMEEVQALIRQAEERKERQLAREVAREKLEREERERERQEQGKQAVKKAEERDKQRAHEFALAQAKSSEGSSGYLRAVEDSVNPRITVFTDNEDMDVYIARFEKLGKLYG